MDNDSNRAVAASTNAAVAAERASSAAALSRRCRGQQRWAYMANVAGRVSIRRASAVDAQSTTTQSHRPEDAKSATACKPSISCIPGIAHSSSGATSSSSESGNREPSTDAVGRHAASSNANVSSAIASRNPPPVPARSSVRIRTGSLPARGGTVSPRTSPSE